MVQSRSVTAAYYNVCSLSCTVHIILLEGWKIHPFNSSTPKHFTNINAARPPAAILPGIVVVSKGPSVFKELVLVTMHAKIRMSHTYKHTFFAPPRRRGAAV